MSGWDPLLDRFADARVVVVGESVLDGWYAGRSRSLSREAPVPVLRVGEESYAPGGAANTARSLAALGAQVRFVSAVGDDRDGAQLRELLAEARVADDAVLAVPQRRTIAKRRLLADTHLLLRYDTGDPTPLPAAAEDALAERLADEVAGADVVLACDYAAGLFSPGLVEHVGRVSAEQGVPLVVDAHEPARWAAQRPYAVKPDAEEVETLLPAAGLAAFRADRLGTVLARADDLLRAAGTDLLVVTLDADGAVVLAPGTPAYRVPAEPLELAHTTGAGDTFLAGFAVAVAAGADPRTAAELGAAAAAVVVREPGTAACSPAQLRDRLAGADDRLVPVDRLARCADTHRALGRRIVFTNGIFDGLHRGHVAHLQAAKELGDVLVVAVNSDDSVRRLHGPDGPEHSAEDRAAVLAGLSAVDHLVVFDGDTPADLLRLVRPDVYVKGGDYTAGMLDDLPEAPLVRALGGEVRILEYVDGSSVRPVSPLRTP